ncbi:hypothetical protein AHAS_Ahas04G0079800 [Arachis hypogaea]
MADQHWVARKLEKRLLSQPWLTHAEAWDHMKVDYNVILSDKMLYRGLQMARKKYVGNEKAQYGKLRDYLNEIHRYEGLLPALKEVMPNAHHRNCVRHIWKNFTNKYKDTQLKNVVWACAKSSTVVEFNDNMQRLKRMNEDAWAYLAKLDPGCWTKSKFSHYPKLDNITNNMTEVWNAKIVHYSKKPILTMLEELICYIMRRMAQHKKALSMYTSVVAPVQQKRMEVIMKDTKHWTAQWTGDDTRQVFEVQMHMKKLGVHLGNNTCTCNMWQLTGIPCVHAMAAIAKRGDRPDTYVHKWLKMDAFRATYGHSISPVNSEEYWEKSGEISSIPPKIKRPIGRPVKRRR